MCMTFGSAGRGSVVGFFDIIDTGLAASARSGTLARADVLATGPMFG